jgi:hypothetical protein
VMGYDSASSCGFRLYARVGFLVPVELQHSG